MKNAKDPTAEHRRQSFTHCMQGHSARMTARPGLGFKEYRHKQWRHPITAVEALMSF